MGFLFKLEKIDQFCFNLSNNFKIKEDTSRWIMSEYFKKSAKYKKIKLPRNKKIITDPQSQWFKSELKDYIFDNFNSLNFKNNELFNSENVIKNYEKFIKEEKGSSFAFMQILSSFRFVETFKNF